MDDARWNVDDFRSFLAALWGDDTFLSGADEFARDAFRHQAMMRVAPDVQRRILADIGVALDASGIAATALDVLEDAQWGKRRTWIRVTPEPWMLLADLVARRIVRSYRASVRSADARALAGIADASSRAELGQGGGEAP